MTNFNALRFAVFSVFFAVSSLEPCSVLAFEFSLLARNSDIRGFYIEYSPFTADSFEARLDKAKQQGYNTIIIPLSSWNAQLGESGPVYRLNMGAGIDGGYSPVMLSNMVALVRSKGLEPVLSINAVGKVMRLFGDLATDNPMLIYDGDFSAVWNPLYVCPNGDSFEEGVLAPLIEELIGVYGVDPPKYILISMDELDKGALATAAAVENITAGQFMARELNRTVALVLGHQVTPIIYQDMLMSKELAQAGVVAGFPGDDRLAYYEPMNGSRAAFGGGSVMDAVDLITNRDQIIVADWHYFGGAGSDETAYPSIEYFQTLGFKEVWGVSWYDMDTTRDFSAYARAHAGQGMLAAVWFAGFKEEYSDVVDLISHNSLQYYTHDNLPETHAPAICVQDGSGEHVVLVQSGDWITLTATRDLPESISSATFSVRANNRTSWDQMLIATETNGVWTAQHQIIANSGAVYDVKVDVLTEDQLLHFGYREGAFLVE